MNYFEFYDMDISFEIDGAELRNKYISMSKKYHPDHHAEADPNELMDALQQSSFNNQAYKTLKDEDLRMRYILELHDILDDSGASLPQNFLMEMMDLNEELMELNTNDKKNVLAFGKKIEDIHRQLREKLKPALLGYPTNPEQSLPQIKDYYLKKKYLERLRENIGVTD